MWPHTAEEQGVRLEHTVFAAVVVGWEHQVPTRMLHALAINSIAVGDKRGYPEWGYHFYNIVRKVSGWWKLEFLSSASLLHEALCTVKMREECRFADQPLLLAGVFTGSADLSCDQLERAQWGPVCCAVTKVLMQERKRNVREKNITVEAADMQLTLPVKIPPTCFSIRMLTLWSIPSQVNS